MRPEVRNVRVTCDRSTGWTLMPAGAFAPRADSASSAYTGTSGIPQPGAVPGRSDVYQGCIGSRQYRTAGEAPETLGLAVWLCEERATTKNTSDSPSRAAPPNQVFFMVLF